MRGAPSQVVEALMDADQRCNLAPLTLVVRDHSPDPEDSDFILKFVIRVTFQDRDGNLIDKSEWIARLRNTQQPWPESLRRELASWLAPLRIKRGRGFPPLAEYLANAESVFDEAARNVRERIQMGEDRESAIAEVAKAMRLRRTSIRNKLEGRRRSDTRRKARLQQLNAEL